MKTNEEIQDSFKNCDLNFATVKYHIERLYLHSLVIFIIAVVEAIFLVIK